MTDGLLEVGRITKAHGLLGEVTVHLWSDLEERLAPGTVLSTDRGELTVVATRRHQGRYLVFFDGVVDRSGAEALRGTVLRAEPVDIPGALFVHELIGCAVVTRDGTDVGVIAAVESNPASDLCVLEDGRLIPLVFVVEHEPGVRVVIDPPPGLVD